VVLHYGICLVIFGMKFRLLHALLVFLAGGGSHITEGCFQASCEQLHLTLNSSVLTPVLNTLAGNGIAEDVSTP